MSDEIIKNPPLVLEIITKPLMVVDFEVQTTPPLEIQYTTMRNEIIENPPLILEIITQPPVLVEFEVKPLPSLEMFYTTPGPKGDPGPPGVDSITFVFTQSLPSNEWLVTHGLTKYPSITVVDSGGTVVYGDVEYLSDQMVKITFSSTFSGQVYCN